MNITLKGVQPAARPKKYVAADDVFTTEAPQEEARPAHWIPGAGPLPADFFLPTLA